MTLAGTSPKLINDLLWASGNTTAELQQLRALHYVHQHAHIVRPLLMRCSTVSADENLNPQVPDGASELLDSTS